MTMATGQTVDRPPATTGCGKRPPGCPESAANVPSKSSALFRLYTSPLATRCDTPTSTTLKPFTMDDKEKHRMKMMAATAVMGSLVLAAGGTALAQAPGATEKKPAASATKPVDGSAPLQCAIQTVMVCDDPSICVRGSAQTVNLPPVVKVDVAKRLISGAATGRTVRITSVSRGSGRILLQGEEVGMNGFAWDMVIVEASGVMSGAVLSHGGGFLMFGGCSTS